MPKPKQGDVKCHSCGNVIYEVNDRFDPNVQAHGNMIYIKESVVKQPWRKRPIGIRQFSIRCIKCEKVIPDPATWRYIVCDSRGGFVRQKKCRICGLITNPASLGSHARTCEKKTAERKLKAENDIRDGAASAMMLFEEMVTCMPGGA
jgi:DNA-directed RNA polymerase subunit N (RpoN/RPB10)